MKKLMVLMVVLLLSGTALAQMGRGPRGGRGFDGKRPEITEEMKEKFQARRAEMVKKFAEAKKDGKRPERPMMRGRGGPQRGPAQLKGRGFRGGHTQFKGRGFRGGRGGPAQFKGRGPHGPRGRGTCEAKVCKREDSPKRGKGFQHRGGRGGGPRGPMHGRGFGRRGK